MGHRLIGMKEGARKGQERGKKGARKGQERDKDERGGESGGESEGKTAGRRKKPGETGEVRIRKKGKEGGKNANKYRNVKGSDNLPKSHYEYISHRIHIIWILILAYAIHMRGIEVYLYGLECGHLGVGGRTEGLKN